MWVLELSRSALLPAVIRPRLPDFGLRRVASVERSTARSLCCKAAAHKCMLRRPLSLWAAIGGKPAGHQCSHVWVVGSLHMPATGLLCLLWSQFPPCCACCAVLQVKMITGDQVRGFAWHRFFPAHTPSK